MLHLKHPADDTAQDAQRLAPLADDTALAFERALLADDSAERHREVSGALAADEKVARWALRMAEMRLGRTINRTQEAADWLSGCLESELAASLASDVNNTSASGIQWRLPALVSKLTQHERLLRDFDRRLEREKLESLKELAYGASHEINNPLANIAARAQTLLEDETDPERRRKLSAIHRQAMRAHEMISDLMLFARPPKLNITPCDVGQLVSRVVEEMRGLAAEHAVELRWAPPEQSIQTSADETQLGVAVNALVMNAIEAVGNDGHVDIEVSQTLDDNETWIEISVRDDGPGVSDEVRRHMFDPFFSGREAGRGLGFGLSKCWRIVTDHGGRVVVQQMSNGAQINILLPLAT